MTSLTKSELHLLPLYCTAPALARAGYHHGDRQRSAATTAQCQALDAADCAASGRLVRTTSPARLSLRRVHRLLNCARFCNASNPNPKRPADCDDFPARCQPPNGPVEILSPCSPQSGPRGSLVRRRCILRTRKPPKRARKRGPCADRRSQRNKVGWLAGETVQIGPVSDRHSLLTGKF